MKRVLLPLILALAVAACDRGGAPADTVPVAEAPAPAAAPAETAPPAEPTAADPTAAAPATDTPASADPAVDGATTDAASTPADPAATPAVAETPAAPATAAPPPYDPATSPKRGVDFEVLSTPQPTFAQGGIEVAEVFAYTCIHCATLQPSVTPWKAALPDDVRVEYVPAVFGGVWDNFARAYFAAQAMGVLEKTHDATFNAVLVEQKAGAGSLEEIADYYATQGVDRAAFLSTMQSFTVDAKLNRAKQFAVRAGVAATPTMIVNGKYVASMTRDGGPAGLLRTVDYLVAHERAGTTPP